MNLRISDNTRYLGIVPQYDSLAVKQSQLQQEIASGKRITSADVDPVGVEVSQRMATETSRWKQDARNSNLAGEYSQTTEGVISTATDALQRAQELAIQANDPTRSASDRQAMATEIDGILRNIISLGAQQDRGQNVLSGTKTDVAAFQAVTDASGNITGVTYNGNGEQMSTEAQPGTTVAYSMAGSNENGGSFGLFRDTGSGTDIFNSLISLRDNLNTNNTAGLSANSQQITDDLSHLSVASTMVGGVQQQLNSATQLGTNKTTLIGSASSQITDTDVAQTITNLNALQTSYQATLAVGARVGQISLLNYLR